LLPLQLLFRLFHRLCYLATLRQLAHQGEVTCPGSVPPRVFIDG
jgi:hypothetical protein